MDNNTFYIDSCMKRTRFMILLIPVLVWVFGDAFLPWYRVFAIFLVGLMIRYYNRYVFFSDRIEKMRRELSFGDLEDLIAPLNNSKTVWSRCSGQEKNGLKRLPKEKQIKTFSKSELLSYQCIKGIFSIAILLRFQGSSQYSGRLLWLYRLHNHKNVILIRLEKGKDVSSTLQLIETYCHNSANDKSFGID